MFSKRLLGLLGSLGKNQNSYVSRLRVANDSDRNCDRSLRGAAVTLSARLRAFSGRKVLQRKVLLLADVTASSSIAAAAEDGPKRSEKRRFLTIFSSVHGSLSERSAAQVAL